MKYKKKPPGEGFIAGWEIQPAAVELLTPFPAMDYKPDSQQSPLTIFEIEEHIPVQQSPVSTEPVYTSTSPFFTPIQTKAPEQDSSAVFTVITHASDPEFFIPTPLPVFPSLPPVTTPVIPEAISINLTTPIPYILPTPTITLATTKGQLMVKAIEAELQARGMLVNTSQIWYIDNITFVKMVSNATTRANLYGRQNIPIISFTNDELASAFRVKGYRPESDQTEFIAPTRRVVTGYTIPAQPSYFPDIPTRTPEPSPEPSENYFSTVPVPSLIPERPVKGSDSKSLLYVGAGLLALFLIK